MNQDLTYWRCFLLAMRQDEDRRKLKAKEEVREPRDCVRCYFRLWFRYFSVEEMDNFTDRTLLRERNWLAGEPIVRPLRRRRLVVLGSHFSGIELFEDNNKNDALHLPIQSRWNHAGETRECGAYVRLFFFFSSRDLNSIKDSVILYF